MLLVSSGKAAELHAGVKDAAAAAGGATTAAAVAQGVSKLLATTDSTTKELMLKLGVPRLKVVVPAWGVLDSAEKVAEMVSLATTPAFSADLAGTAEGYALTPTRTPLLFRIFCDRHFILATDSTAAERLVTQHRVCTNLSAGAEVAECKVIYQSRAAPERAEHLVAGMRQTTGRGASKLSLLKKAEGKPLPRSSLHQSKASKTLLAEQVLREGARYHGAKLHERGFVKGILKKVKDRKAMNSKALIDELKARFPPLYPISSKTKLLKTLAKGNGGQPRQDSYQPVPQAHPRLRAAHPPAAAAARHWQDQGRPPERHAPGQGDGAAASGNGQEGSCPCSHTAA